MVRSRASVFNKFLWKEEWPKKLWLCSARSSLRTRTIMNACAAVSILVSFSGRIAWMYFKKSTMLCFIATVQKYKLTLCSLNDVLNKMTEYVFMCPLFNRALVLVIPKLFFHLSFFHCSNQVRQVKWSVLSLTFLYNYINI